jgi:cation diffusion facilitator CzcD-associated flavoprotein CzcO
MKEAIIVGAGPYGLSVAAHLEALGVDYVLFGQPLDTWLNHVPQGMTLKSDGFASSLSCPRPESTLRAYCTKHGIEYHDTAMPVRVETFTDYAQDFQRRYVSHVDRRNVASLSSNGTFFTVGLDDGTQVKARKLILSVGITHFAHFPPELRNMDRRLVTHSSDHHDVTAFRGATVAVLGAGASAVDLALHLAETGADVHLLARAPTVRFSSVAKPGGRSLWQRLRHPKSGLGSGMRSRFFSDYPQFYRFLPDKLRLEIVRRHLGPSSPGYMKTPLYDKVKVMTGCSVRQLHVNGNRVNLALNTAAGPAKDLAVDHVIAATGYEVDMKRVPFLEAKLCDAIDKVSRYPRLNGNMETSVPGLYVCGIAAAGSFGPLMRFVYGCDFAAKRISRDVKLKLAS